MTAPNVWRSLVSIKFFASRDVVTRRWLGSPLIRVSKIDSGIDR